MRPKGPRDPIVGPDSGPEPPLFPLKLSGEVIKGFGRGSKELGIPTANIPITGLAVGGQKDLPSGIYFGWAGLDFPESDGAATQHDKSLEKTKPTEANIPDGAAKLEDRDEMLHHQADQRTTQRGTVYPMVMSIGWNPFYKNEKRSVEVHIMHHFPRDFYGHHLNTLILGFIRPEYDYVSKEALIEDIEKDIEVAHQSLARSTYEKYRMDPYLKTFPTA